METSVKLRSGGRFVPAKLTYKPDIIICSFRYDPNLLVDIKAMDGAKWNPENKTWSVKNTGRNRFNLMYMQGIPVFQRYEWPLVEFFPTRGLYDHQVEMVRHMITRKQCILAAEMGVGKTLACIEAMEWAFMKANIRDWLWVGPKSALAAVQMEFRKWNGRIWPQFCTYDSLRNLVTANRVPEGIVFDECSKIKNPSAQRSQASLTIADRMREANAESYIIEMSGSPAPRNPSDWFMLTEVACPGFIKEGNIHKFQRRLGFIEERESLSGGVYPHLVTWFDNEELCKRCGLREDEGQHDIMSGGHQYTRSVNEVKLLGERMRGLTLVQFKKDCLSLPEKIYREIVLEPTEEVVRLANLITQTSPRAATALINLRELSDGFQYKDVKTDEKTECGTCHGSGKSISFEEGTDYATCPACGGKGNTSKIVRSVITGKTPKDDCLRDLLEEYEDVGRVVIYGGFQGTIDKIVDLCVRAGWATLKVDGRGWYCEGETDPVKMLEKFQTPTDECPKMVFIGQPGAAGMGLTLTASPVIIFYSNDFNAESRIQAEDRIHRPGMDANRGATIIDLIHLPTDRAILDNLKRKRELQELSMIELNNYMKGDKKT